MLRIVSVRSLGLGASRCFSAKAEDKTNRLKGKVAVVTGFEIFFGLIWI